MLHTIYINDDLYSELARRAGPNDTLEDVIRALLAEVSSVSMSPVSNTTVLSSTQQPTRRGRTSVADWKKHIYLCLDSRDDETDIGTPDWTRAIYNNLRTGEPAFGITGTNAAEAMLEVIKEREPAHYEQAIEGLRLSILEAQAKGGKLKKVAAMWERVSGRTLRS